MKKIFLSFLLIFLGGISFGNTASTDTYSIIRERFSELTNNSSSDEKAQKLLNTLNTNLDRTYLWEQFPDMKNGPHILSTYRNLTDIIKAYTDKNSSLYQNNDVKNTIITSLNWLRENAYRENLPELGNWWQWEIGIPKELNRIVAYMYPDLSKEQVEIFLNGSRYFQPYAEWSGYSEGAKTSTSPNKRLSTGGNRIDTCYIVFMRGILTQNKNEVVNALNNLGEVAEYVTAGDGFYKDGSFIQHGTIPYGGTYGEVLLSGLGAIQNLVANTNLEIKDPRFNNIYDSIINGYNYLFFNSRVSDSISGRAVTRKNSSDLTRGVSNLVAIAMISQGAPEDYKIKLQEIVKRNIETGDKALILSRVKNPVEKKVIENILNDKNIKILPPSGIKIFGNMDRVVNRTPNYSFVLSLHSSRVGNFESILEENTKGWHAADGMYYIYTPNLTEYFEYWPTVDPYHLPGTTESITQRENSIGERRHPKTMVQKDFVGGTTNNIHSMIGMDFSSWNDLTTAKKSWFITPDFIVSMGSNISSEDGEIHTTIENKSIKSDNEIIKNTDDKLVLKNPSSNLYTAFTTLDNNTLTTTTEKRVGSWDKDKTEISKNFIKSFINHGSNPKDSSYLYAIIPENKLDFIENFNKNDIKILSQNNFAHGINFKNITAINFWKESENKVGIFSSKSPIALLAIDNKNSISISVSDPTHKNSTVIFTIDGKYKLETINTNIKTIVSQNTTTITVSNLKNGATENFTLIPKES